MQQLREMPMATLAIVAGVITAVAWITLDGTVPLVISVVAGAIIAVKATLGEEQ